MLRRSVIKPVSDKRKADHGAYDRAKQIAWNRDHGGCRAAKVWPEVECSGVRDPHHIKPQGRYPELRCDPDNLIVLCRGHHFQIHHVDPLRARSLGLLF